MAEEGVFDPRAVLAALDRNYVSYVLIGGLARVIRGTNEITGGVDICPSVRPENLERLGRALEELEARRADRRRLALDEETLARERVLRLRTTGGEVKVVAEPAGTRRGYEDLRRGASREHIGRGLRPTVASVGILHGWRLRSPGSVAWSRVRVSWSGCGSVIWSCRGSCGGSWRWRLSCSGRSAAGSSTDSQPELGLAAVLAACRSHQAAPALRALDPHQLHEETSQPSDGSLSGGDTAAGSSP